MSDDTMVAVKHCPACGATKPVDAFGPRTDGRGLRYRCHECECEYSRKRYADGDHVRAAARYAAKRVAAGFPPPVSHSPSLTYRAVHKRIQRARGKASGHKCAHCVGRAAQWAYDYADPYPMIGFASDEVLCLYSPDVMRYLPLCRGCHRRFDAGR